MSQEDFFQNEVVEELVRERAHKYLAVQDPIDFWVLIAPGFIKNAGLEGSLKLTQFYRTSYKNIRSISDGERLYNYNKLEFYASIVTTNESFIEWIKLRLGNCEEITDPISTLPTLRNISHTEPIDKKYKIVPLCPTGAYGSFKLSQLKENTSPLDHNPMFIQPNILINQYKEAVDLYYQQYFKDN